jgi:hypothetical protein
MTFEEFKSLEVYNAISRKIAPDEAFDNGIMCSWSTNIVFKTTSKYSSELYVKDLSLEDFEAQRELNNYIEKQIIAERRLNKLQTDF